MTILSFNYFFLLIITFIAYYSVPKNYKYWIIFISSTSFVTLISIYALQFSLLYIGINYLGGLFIYKNNENSNLRKFIFWSFISLNIGILVFFKYINFIFENINSLFEVFQTSSRIELINLILPIGISYYTFQSIGYLIRINREFEIPEKNLIRFSSFLLFFPKFISGPVERSNHFLPQLWNLNNFSQDAVTSGLRLILLGAFKKMVIADNLFGPISSVYSNVHHYSGIPLVSVLFIQLIYIYCDFSGYTDIALGSAKIFGIDLIDNFKRPFLAKTITEFWKRWHISLSSWCNEFIYFPFIVKYRKLGNIASILGITITFLVIGIWHGANWTYIILGILQASAIIYEFFTKKYRIKAASKAPIWVTNLISRILVFIFMGISMVFFFSRSISDAKYFLSHLFLNIDFKFSGHELNINKQAFIAAICCFFVLFILEILNEKGNSLLTFFDKQPKWKRWIIYYTMIILIYFLNTKTFSFTYGNF